MSMYNMMFGVNPITDLLLATLDLRRSDVGRFRDCFISEGTIAVYTRNGSGNRHCWCKENPKYGVEKCEHIIQTEEINETYDATEEEIKAHPEWELLNIFKGAKRTVKTGKRIMHDFYICQSPGSKKCACPGCVIEHRLPKHPLYIRDEDDDYDSTYATIYFKFPEEYAEDLKKLDTGEKFDPDERWMKVLAFIKGE